MQKTYDVTFIGSGPISILEALNQNKLGKKALILDRSSEIGGAWGTLTLPGNIEIEIGCHIWSTSKQAHTFLRNYLGIDTKPLAPQPYILGKNYKCTYDWKMNILSLRRIKENLKNGRIFQILKDLKSPRFRLSIIPAKYQYPTRGATSLKKALRSKLRDSSIETRLKVNANAVIYKQTHIEIRTDEGEIIKSKEIYLTSLSSIKTFETNDKTVEPKYRTLNYIHIHLILSDKEGKALSYVRIIDNEIIHRISDVTSQAIGSENRILIVGIHQKAYTKIGSENIIGSTIEEAKKLGFIGKNTSLIHSKLNIYPAQYLDTDSIKHAMKDFDGKIKLLQSTDLMYSIHEKLHDWVSLSPRRF